MGQQLVRGSRFRGRRLCTLQARGSSAAGVLPVAAESWSLDGQREQGPAHLHLEPPKNRRLYWRAPRQALQRQKQPPPLPMKTPRLVRPRSNPICSMAEMRWLGSGILP